MTVRTENRKGFTLAELLIVVAIIGILVAIGIPIFNKQLEKSRAAASAANIRSAYSEAVTEYISFNPSDLRQDNWRTDGYHMYVYQAYGTPTSIIVITEIQKTKWDELHKLLPELTNSTNKDLIPSGKYEVCVNFEGSGNPAVSLADLPEAWNNLDQH